MSNDSRHTAAKSLYQTSRSTVLHSVLTHESTCSALFVTTPLWISSVAQSYSTDSHAKELLAKLSLDGSSMPHFQLQNGLLRYKQRIWIGDNNNIKCQLVEVFPPKSIGRPFGYSSYLLETEAGLRVARYEIFCSKLDSFLSSVPTSQAGPNPCSRSSPATGHTNCCLEYNLYVFHRWTAQIQEL